jgi:CheY-like chemotaxis protein
MSNMQKPKSKYKIVMLVDDNEIDNMINQKMLESANFADQFYVYTSGQSALDFLENLVKQDSARELLPDMILLDINMPLIDGFQFLDKYAELNTSVKPDVDVFMLTTSINPSDKERADENKLITKFLIKPLTAEQLESL